MNHMPQTPAEITAVWLTEALRSTGTIGEETAVSAINVQTMDGAGYVGQVARVALSYEPQAANAPNTLIAKFSNPDPDIRAVLHDLYLREVHVYQALANQISLLLPSCYYGEADAESGHAILLLEDLAHLQTRSPGEGCSRQDAEIVVTQFARHHAQWWEDPRIYNNEHLRAADALEPDYVAMYQTWAEQFEPKFRAAFPNVPLPASFLDLGLRYAKQIQAVYEQVAAAPFTFAHRDPHFDNLMFAADENGSPLTVIDWQLCNGGTGASDIAYFMISSLPFERRRRAEKHLIQRYHTELQTNGVANYSPAQCWRDYRLGFFRSLRVATAVVGMMDLSRPHAQEFLPALVARLISFAQDHAVHEFLLGEEQAELAGFTSESGRFKIENPIGSH